MSVSERIWNGLRDVIVMNEKLRQLAAASEDLEGQVSDHERRLVRIETMIEMAGGSRAAASLPPRGMDKA